MCQFQSQTTLSSVNIPQKVSTNNHTNQVAWQSAVEKSSPKTKDSQFLVPKSHTAGVIPEGYTSLLCATQNQHGEIYLNNYQVEHQNRDTELWFFPHHHWLLDEAGILQKEILCNDLQIIYDDWYNDAEYNNLQNLVSNSKMEYTVK